MVCELFAFSFDDLMDFIQVLVSRNKVRETSILNVVAAERWFYATVGQLTLLSIRFVREMRGVRRWIDRGVSRNGGMGHVEGRRR